MHKVAPLLALMVGAALMRRSSTRWAWLVLAIAFVLVVSLAGMKVNVLTDELLDRAQKPQLYRWLTSNRALLRTSLIVESAAAGALLAVGVLWCDRWFVAALAASALAFILYSYNFLWPRDPAGSRLKVTWWGNLTAVCGGYFALWMVGLQASAAGAPSRAWWLVAAGASLVDYGVFLNECASDAEDEQRAGLRTFPALLGARRTADVALAVLIAGGATCMVVVGRSALDWSPRGPLALAWLVSFQLVACVVVRARGQWLARETRRERFVDISFCGARLGMVALLLLPVRW
jgi:4-hydroxybenzoate polyprenyltransferase